MLLLCIGFVTWVWPSHRLVRVEKSFFFFSGSHTMAWVDSKHTVKGKQLD